MLFKFILNFAIKKAVNQPLFKGIEKSFRMKFFKFPLYFDCTVYLKSVKTAETMPAITEMCRNVKRKCIAYSCTAWSYPTVERIANAC